MIASLLRRQKTHPSLVLDCFYAKEEDHNPLIRQEIVIFFMAIRVEAKIFEDQIMLKAEI